MWIRFLLSWLFYIKPRKRTELKAGKIDRTLVPKEFDEKFKWDKKKFENIIYV